MCICVQLYRSSWRLLHRPPIRPDFGPIGCGWGRQCRNLVIPPYPVQGAAWQFRLSYFSSSGRPEPDRFRTVIPFRVAPFRRRPAFLPAGRTVTRRPALVHPKPARSGACIRSGRFCLSVEALLIFFFPRLAPGGKQSGIAPIRHSPVSCPVRLQRPQSGRAVHPPSPRQAIGPSR